MVPHLLVGDLLCGGQRIALHGASLVRIVVRQSFPAVEILTIEQRDEARWRRVVDRGLGTRRRRAEVDGLEAAKLNPIIMASEDEVAFTSPHARVLALIDGSAVVQVRVNDHQRRSG